MFLNRVIVKIAIFIVIFRVFFLTKKWALNKKITTQFEWFLLF
jgi:hypothetical protein